LRKYRQCWQRKTTSLTSPTSKNKIYQRQLTDTKFVKSSASTLKHSATSMTFLLTRSCFHQSKKLENCLDSSLNSFSIANSKMAGQKLTGQQTRSKLSLKDAFKSGLKNRGFCLTLLLDSDSSSLLGAKRFRFRVILTSSALLGAKAKKPREFTQKWSMNCLKADNLTCTRMEPALWVFLWPKPPGVEVNLCFLQSRVTTILAKKMRKTLIRQMRVRVPKLACLWSIWIQLWAKLPRMWVIQLKDKVALRALLGESLEVTHLKNRSEMCLKKEMSSWKTWNSSKIWKVLHLLTLLLKI